jgi:hypothetical protein
MHITAMAFSATAVTECCAAQTARTVSAVIEHLLKHQHGSYSLLQCAVVQYMQLLNNLAASCAMRCAVLTAAGTLHACMHALLAYCAHNNREPTC